MITLKNISKSFKSGKSTVLAVQDVSLEISRGDIYGIIGYSGAGKSTLVRCINLLERPTKGSVIVDGQELTALSNTDLLKARKKIGMIFQHFALMPSRTIAANVDFPLKGLSLSAAERKQRVAALLELVGIADKATAYPAELSGGQKQRAAIARALVTNPDVLICDEATSALDPQTTSAILKLLKELNKKLGITLVVIAHDMDVVKEICNKVAVMKDGKIIEKNGVYELFSEPKEKLTRDFINSTSNLSKVDSFLEKNESITAISKGEVLVRLNYLRRNAQLPIITTTARQFNVDLDIIFADVDVVDGVPIGGTVAIVSGENNAIGAALNNLSEHEVKVEVLRDERVAD